MRDARDSSVRGWLQLLRPANLLTVPGDPVSGFLLASTPGMASSPVLLIPLAGISLLFYMAGLISNDCLDRRQDAVARPERPIPSGVVGLRAAAIAAVVLVVAGLGLAGLISRATLLVALGLAVLIVAYNTVGKRLPVAGALLMGACRGFSLLLGASAAGMPSGGWNAVSVAAAGLALYIAAVTSLAARETEQHAIPFRRWLPAAAVACCMLGLVHLRGAWDPVFAVLAAAAVIWPVVLAWRLSACPSPARLIPSIGGFIRGVLLIQAAFLTSTGHVRGMAAAVAVLCLWPASLFLSRRFYAS